MGLAREHDLHRRRLSRNVGLAIVLAAFVALIFGLTMVKMQTLETGIVGQEVRR